MPLQKSFFLLHFIFLPLLLFPQKIEAERQVSPDQVPRITLDFLSHEYPGRKNVLYYQEQNETGQFYEVKFSFQGSRYSVKFTSDGRLNDTERLVRFRDLPEPEKKNITDGLTRLMRRFRIIKVQEQLVDEERIGYEIEIRSNSSGYVGYFEAHFDAEGRYKDIRRIGSHPKDHLFF